MTDQRVDYIKGRIKYARPQAILWSENSGTLVDGFYVPDGYEIGTNPNPVDSGIGSENAFIMLSDHNRNTLDFKPIRIETRQRMVNGRMRSNHIADKMSLSVSWNMLPSRSFGQNPDFDVATGLSGSPEYTVDGGAGGVELLDWYENHTGSFWVFLSYDKYNNFGSDDAAYQHLNQYSEVLEMFITDFTYSVQKRGSSNYDMWNVSVTLEEA
jgi:hypothetical protein